jgi:hypothetical protein
MKRLALALSVGCAASALAGAALADPPGKVGRVAWIEDEVSFLPPGEQSWTWASVNYPVTDGESFWTGDAGRTEIQVGPIEVSADSETELDVLALDYGRTRLGLPQGSLDLKLWRTPRGGVTISTPAGDVVIDQPGEYRIDVGAPQDDGGYTPVEVTVFDGHAGAPGQVGLTDIGPGAAAVIYPGYDPEMQYAQDASIDDWARTREASEDWDVQAAYSPDVTGYGELAAYGDFVQDPNYGSVWYPAGVPYDWAPYRYGRWAYVAPWGYTWVDDQPWGFAPFHYGRWAQIDGRWGWIPGQPVPQPVYAPALVAFIGGLAFGGGGGVGWIPLGPDEVYRPPYQVSDRYLRQVNVTSVSTTTINNITVNNVTNVTQYRNARAAMVVPAGSFAGGAPVQKAAVAVTPAALAQARPGAALAALPPPTPAARAAGGFRGAGAPAGAAPPANLQAIHAAVAAQPAGATRPPAIPGAHTAPPRARPPGAPAFVGPAQIKNPGAQARQPVPTPTHARPGPPAVVPPTEPTMMPGPMVHRPAPTPPSPEAQPTYRPAPPPRPTPPPAYRPPPGRPVEAAPPHPPAATPAPPKKPVPDKRPPEDHPPQ